MFLVTETQGTPNTSTNHLIFRSDEFQTSFGRSGVVCARLFHLESENSIWVKVTFKSSIKLICYLYRSSNRLSFWNNSSQYRSMLTDPQRRMAKSFCGKYRFDQHNPGTSIPSSTFCFQSLAKTIPQKFSKFSFLPFTTHYLYKNTIVLAKFFTSHCTMIPPAEFLFPSIICRIC